MLNLTLSPKRFARFLLYVAVALVAIGLLVIPIYGLQAASPEKAELWRKLAHLVSVDAEMNPQTYFSSMILLISSILLGIIAIARQRDRAPFVRHWQILAGLFLYLSMDEILMIHDRMSPLVEQVLHPHGAFAYGWVIPAIPLCIVLAVAYFNFLVHLPKRFCQLFILAGSLYIGAAVGIELITAYDAELFGETSLPYVLWTSVEEFCEMFGVILFIYALLTYIAGHVGELRIAVAGATGLPASDDAFDHPTQ